MSQAESKLSREIMDALRLDGHFCFKVHGNEFMMSGLPDIIVCAQGHFLGLETKMPEKRTNTSVKQDRVHQQIRDAGGTAIVVTSIAEARAAVARAL